MDQALQVSAWPGRRARLTGAWRSGDVVGTFAFSAGPRDDHLELEATNGRLSEAMCGTGAGPQADLEFQDFADGYGLSILRLLDSGSPLARAAAIDRVNDLVECLRTALPGLQLLPGVASCEPDRSPCHSGEVTVELAPQGPSFLAEAAVALESGNFKRAERAAQQARAAGEDDASEVLATVAAIRRADKAVRRHPRDPQAHLALAWGYFQADAGQAALSEAWEALRLDSNVGEAHLLIGFEQHYRGDQQAAWEGYERARQLLSPDHEWVRRLADLLHEADGSQRLQDDPPSRAWSELLRMLPMHVLWA